MTWGRLAGVFLVFFSISLSAENGATSSNELCDAILHAVATPDFVELSPYRMLPESSSAITTVAAKGLSRLLDLPEGYPLLLSALERFGLAVPDPKDPQGAYGPLALVAREGSVDLKERHPDPAVEAFIAAELRPRWRRGELPQVLENKERRQFFSSQLRDFLGEVRHPENRKALIILGTEIERLHADLRADRTTEDEFLADVERLVPAFGSRVRTLPKPWGGFPKLATATLGEIPFVGLGLTYAESAVGAWKERSRRRKRAIRDASKTYPKEERIPESHRMGVLNPDPLGNRKLASRLIGDVLRGDIENLFSPEFAERVQRAYPEVRELRHGAVISNKPPHYRAEGAWQKWGEGNFESDKAFDKTALFLSMLAGRQEAFSGMNKSTFDQFRSRMLKALDIVPSHVPLEGANRVPWDTYHMDRIDQFLAFLHSEAIGRGKGEFLTALEESYNLDSELQADHETRAVALLARYPFASSSIMGQAPGVREDLLDAVTFVPRFNAGKVTQGESGSSAFNGLEGANDRQIAYLFHKALFSHGAIPQGGRHQSGTSALKPEVSTEYDQLWAALEEYGKTRDSKNAQTQLMADLSRSTGPSRAARPISQQVAAFEMDALESVPIAAPQPEQPIAAFDSPAGQGVLQRLARQTRDRTLGNLPELEQALGRVEPQLQQRLVDFLAKYPVDMHFSGDLLADISAQVHDPVEARSIWLSTVARVFKWAEEHGTFPNALRTAERRNHEIRINFYPFVQYLDRGSVETLRTPGRIGVGPGPSGFQVYVVPGGE